MSVLDTAKSFLLTEVAAKANEIDSNPDALFHAFRGLAKLNLLALKIPKIWGGAQVSEQTFSSFQEIVARYSGALAFLQTQHQSAAGMLLASSNSFLQEKYLSRMGNGEVLLGVGFSQLRRGGEPLTVAKLVSGGYQLDGIVPWITGFNLFSEFIVAATLPDNSAVFGLVPFQETHQETGGNVRLNTPLELAAMTSTNTVSGTFKGWFLPQQNVVFLKPPGWIHENDQNNVLRATFLATGCALAGLDILETASASKSLSFISSAFESLQQELTNCRNAISQAQEYSGEIVERLELRGWAIDLATRIAHAAVTVSSGAANYKHHNAQRVYREALVFTVTGQTSDVMQATLKRLTRSPEMSKRITYSQVIHLSQIITPHIPLWKGDPKVELSIVAEIEKDKYYLRRFCMGEHSATHMNAPNSFYIDGKGIDQYSAESLVVPAVVINVCEQAAIDPDYTLSIADIKNWEAKYGQIPQNCVVLLHTGWQDKWSDANAFFNADKNGCLHFPGFGKDATEFLIGDRQIAGVGIDTHGIDSGQDASFAINHLVLAKPRIVLENLTNLHQLPPFGVTLAIGLIRLQGGSGSPVGVLAFY